ncbi:bifunctional 3-demethylubiquinone-9 3-methyltransferase/ 2-octaprenyl-6-hydroxy phenol methylase [Vibrio aerogenes CECT 7868]|uniref:Bifunctional 3-demethylubiquinone-9 3-methyltransferase/ 2-octaprenyl-6-hydroxy phenol methylase n=1 Tax=Vibrio aerogenes CECT 7868 TaxID=1216006 RepID=A0A1M5ZWJ3_9VIBR|nr:class I SAM-dependent methyltransferase [Vibrio aerogenes]SHI28582.1 bifunctional 3-demethylubiquinone-9 3-methyltransferase/ 2-octaprenyl-6-hydroxy phenol methylase [Vibrio aerogenes CECT 7868]
MAEGWDQLAITWEKDESNIEFAEKAFAELMKKVSPEGCHVLDFGCGTGLLSQFISPHAKSIVALDASESMIEELDKKELVNVEPVVDSLTRGLVAQHPAFRKQFDLIVACSVCGWLPHLAESLTVAYSLLDQGGQFVHWDFISDDEDRASGVGMVEMQDELIQAGFADVHVSRVFKITCGHKQISVMMGIATK